MIITRLGGGLGNQMFQYAVARNYIHNINTLIILDTYLLKKKWGESEDLAYRPYNLYIFKNLKAMKIDESTISNLFLNIELFYKIRNYIYYRSTTLRNIFYRNTTFIIQKFLEPVDLPKKTKKNIIVLGNFQSEDYFFGIRNELIEEFAFPMLDEKNERIKELILRTNHALAIHIRRGDYLSSNNKSIFDSVNMNYYEKSIDFLLKYVEEEKITSFIFTDDVEWAKNNFKHDRLILNFVEGNLAENSWKDMKLMSSCQHHIIANSSFSWWGAWLSTRKGINIAPKYWFKDNTYIYDIKHIIPKSWHIIDYIL